MLKEIKQDSRGNTLYMEDNKAGGHTYWSDEIGGGVTVWDTCLVSEEMLSLAVFNETGKVMVTGEALKEILEVITGPDHLIRELQVLQKVNKMLSTQEDPIGKLTEEYNAHIIKAPDPD